ncbi:aminoglycoside phosphotransferase family protein [Citreimonas salinaria]|uniref:Aminoglycoside phosphotransferase domain-containing protein n=1 Tax=Citreimonas salinaria TaxID=321339 RepID=A0A1H3FBV3_9RHOB|nr:phosphotransferase [Citreimonas salinaria]SDX87848.1 hypothetical protein SAMN05444340_101299 [Citreimonas salinaria]
MNAFLTRAGWADAAREPLAGDASARLYTRLRRADGTAILMQDPGGDVSLFARLAAHLNDLGLSAPRILARDDAGGLLLLEDLGDGLVARLATDPVREAELYRIAVDALVKLHRHAAPADLPEATPDHMASITQLAFSHYAARPEAAAPAIDALRAILADTAAATDVMVLRDYHAENILLLPQRSGAARAGLLDFQDALRGHRAYDLVSLLRDVRRDLFPGTAETAIAHYLRATGTEEAPFRAAMAALGVQRNLRILGVFARLAAEYGKPRYLCLLPRVWAHLQTDLAHPALSPLRRHLDSMPPPSLAPLARPEPACQMP